MDTLLSYFLADIICRAIPGITVIGLYYEDWVKPAAFIHNLPLASRAICIFLFAWLIGLMLDLGTFAVGAVTLENLPQNCWVVSSVREQLLPKYQQEETVSPKAENELEKFNRVTHNKFLAEKVLFRVMSCICFFTILRPPKCFLRVKKARYYLYSTFLFLVFFGLWCWRIKHR